MKLLLVSLLLITSNAFADTITFTWDAVTTDSTGGPVVGLLGYKLYVSPTSGTYGAAPKTTLTGVSTTITENTVGKYFAVVTAYNAAGESSKSNEVTFEIKVKPPAPPGHLSLIQKIAAFFKRIFA